MAHWTVEYKEEAPYLRIFKQFADVTRFGRSFDGIPFHVNSTKNPFPIWSKHAGRRVLDHLTHKDVRLHLSGESPIFLVNRPTGSVHEVVFDIDVVDKDKSCRGQFVADEITRILVPPGFDPFVEPSRHGQGSYLRLLIKRTSQPPKFNRLLLDICEVIKRRYNEHFISDFNAKVCGIKGTVWHRIDNPLFDAELFEAKGFEYEYHKRRYVGSFEPDLHLERYRYNRGILVTAACCNVFADGGHDRYVRYLDWAKQRDDKKVIPEQWLEDWLAKNRTETKTLGGARREAKTPIANSMCDMHRVQCESDGELGTARDGAYDRGLNCYRSLCRHLGRAATKEELHVAYVEQGLNNRPVDHDGSRDRRFDYIVSKYGPTFDINKSGRAGFETRREEIIRIVEQHVLPQHFDEIKYKSRIDNLDLAIALYTVEVNAFQMHEKPEQMYSCGNKAFEGMFKKLSEEESIGDRGCNRHKVVAMKLILQRAGLIEYLDHGYMPAALSRRRIGVGKKIGVGPNHPRRKEFEFVLTHHPVVKVEREEARNSIANSMCDMTTKNELWRRKENETVEL